MTRLTRRQAMAAAVVSAVAAPTVATSLGAVQDDPDQHLLDLEAEIGRVRAELAAMPDSDDIRDPWYDRLWAIEDEIAETSCHTLTGVRVKLCRLLDPEIGMVAGRRENDMDSLGHVQAVIERLGGAS